MEIYNDTYCVYVHINKINGKMYVGQTVHGDNVKKRWRNGGAGYKVQQYFWRAIQKYGWDNFEHEIVAMNLTKEEACNFEKLLIKELNTQDNNFGYNLTLGGDGIYGYHHTIDSINKQKATMRKYYEDPKYIQKMRDVSPRKRMVYQYTDLGDFVASYASGMEAERATGINNATISKCALGRTASVDGYIFLFQDNLCDLSRRVERCKTHAPQRKEHVVQLTPKGECVAEWSSAHAAGKSLNIQYKNINAVCRQVREKAGGFKWMYLSDYIELYGKAI